MLDKTTTTTTYTLTDTVHTFSLKESWIAFFLDRIQAADEEQQQEEERKEKYGTTTTLCIGTVYTSSGQLPGSRLTSLSISIYLDEAEDYRNLTNLTLRTSSSFSSTSAQERDQKHFTSLTAARSYLMHTRTVRYGTVQYV